MSERIRLEQGKNFNGWYLGCTRRYFRRNTHPGYKEYPPFEQITGFFPADFPEVANMVLYIPAYLKHTHKQCRRQEQALVHACILKKDGTKKGFFDDVRDVFNEFEDIVGIGPDRPKVVIVDDGYYNLRDLMRGRYGWVEELKYMAR